MKREQEEINNWSNARLYRANKKIPLEPIERYRERDNEGPWAPAWIVAYCACAAFWLWIGSVVWHWWGR